jgi:hypothetical protein
MVGVGVEPPGWPNELKSKSKLTRAEVEESFPRGTAVRVVGVKGVPTLYGTVMFHMPAGHDHRVLGVCCHDKRPYGPGCFDFGVPVEYLRVISWQALEERRRR